jgi:aryl-alcohol dehydrogenase-like predicted oxidoreductase
VAIEYRRLGDSGLIVSSIGLGTNNFGNRLDESQVRRIVDQAIDCGVNFFDTADIYAAGRSEELIGRVLGARRPNVLIATKFGMHKGELPFQQGAGRRWVIEAVDASLRRLGTDYIDLYQVHQPDPQTPILETLQTLDDLVRQGKVRYHGHSNFRSHQMADAHWTAFIEHLVRPVSAQNHYNLINREAEADVLPAVAAYGLGFIPYLPLASGFLTGKYRPNRTPSGARLDGSAAAARILTPINFDRLESLEAYAKERGRSLAELAFGWLLSRPEVATVIAGASGPEQVANNAAAGGWRLAASEIEEVASL